MSKKKWKVDVPENCISKEMTAAQPYGFMKYGGIKWDDLPPDAKPEVGARLERHYGPRPFVDNDPDIIAWRKTLGKKEVE